MPTYDDDIDPRDEPRDRDDYDDRGGSRGDRVIERAKDAVRGPAIALIVMSIICLLFAGWNIIQAMAFDKAFDAQVKASLEDPKLSADEKKKMQDMFESIKTPVKIFVSMSGGIGLLVGLITMVGGIQMMNLKGRGLAYTGSILSMIPCTSGCCILGLPFGIWAIIVLGRPEVKAGYAAVARGR